MKHIIDTDELQKLIKEKIDLYDSQMEGADYDDFIRNEWAAGAMRQLLQDLRAIISTSPQAEGMVFGELEEVLFGNFGALDFAIQNQESKGNNSVSEGLKALHHALTMLSAYKPQADDVRKDAWISVEDRLPEVETDVIVRGIRFNGLYHSVAGIFDGVFKSQETAKELLFDITHWMPLP